MVEQCRQRQEDGKANLGNMSSGVARAWLRSKAKKVGIYWRRPWMPKCDSWTSFCAGCKTRGTLNPKAWLFQHSLNSLLISLFKGGLALLALFFDMVASPTKTHLKFSNVTVVKSNWDPPFLVRGKSFPTGEDRLCWALHLHTQLPCDQLHVWEMAWLRFKRWPASRRCLGSRAEVGGSWGVTLVSLAPCCWAGSHRPFLEHLRRSWGCYSIGVYSEGHCHPRPGLSVCAL